MRMKRIKKYIIFINSTIKKSKKMSLKKLYIASKNLMEVIYQIQLKSKNKR